MSGHAINVDRLLDLAGAICDESASQDDLAELDSIVLADEDSCRHYVNYCRMHGALRLELWAHQAAQKACQQINIELGVLDLSEPAVVGITPPPVPTPSFLPTALHSTFGYFSSDWSVSYLIATVIMGIGALIAGFTYVSHPAQVARQSPSVMEQQRTVAPKEEFVGRITGMVDCKWADNAADSSCVPLGRKYELASGLMEITYDSGAKVILQGPVSYEVESKNGGFLSIGKLICKVEVEKAKGFTTRTPTATVTDLGTEFGISVDKDQNLHVTVFQGAVETTVTGSGNVAHLNRLTQGESIFVAADTKKITRVGMDSKQFVRDIQKYVAAKTINVKFTHLGKYGLDPSETTGVVPAGFWNNIEASQIPPSVVALRDGTGQSTSAKLTWQWGGDGKVERPSRVNHDEPQGSEEKLFGSGFHGDDAGRPFTIHIDDVPYAHYRVYLYYSLPPFNWQPPYEDEANTTTVTFGVSVNGGKTIVVDRPRWEMHGFYRYKNEMHSGNYAMFDGLEGNLTINTTPDGRGKFHLPFIVGMQVVEIPDREPNGKTPAILDKSLMGIPSQ